MLVFMLSPEQLNFLLCYQQTNKSTTPSTRREAIAVLSAESDEASTTVAGMMKSGGMGAITNGKWFFSLSIGL